MKTHIEGNVYLESDAYQFILKEYTGRVDRRDRREISNTLGYFNNIEHAINCK